MSRIYGLTWINLFALHNPESVLIAANVGLSAYCPHRCMIKFEEIDEPLRVTLSRTLTIAVVVGVVASFATHNIRMGFAIGLGALWPSVGGHWIELLWLNLIRKRLKPKVPILVALRLIYWWAWGFVIIFPAFYTIHVIAPSLPPMPSPLLGGFGFLFVEMLLHGIFAMNHRPNAFDARL